MSRPAEYQSSKVRTNHPELRHLRKLLAFADERKLPDNHPIRISQSARYNNPTDPGGDVTLEIEVALDDQGRVIS